MPNFFFFASLFLHASILQYISFHSILYVYELYEKLKHSQVRVHMSKITESQPNTQQHSQRTIKQTKRTEF